MMRLLALSISLGNWGGISTVTEAFQSQGIVVEVSNGSNILKPGARTVKFKKGEGVLIRWDANAAHNDLVSTSAQRLLSSKWNPKQTHTEGSWRFDFSRK